jgi:hypothetical protein
MPLSSSALKKWLVRLVARRTADVAALYTPGVLAPHPPGRVHVIFAIRSQ